MYNLSLLEQACEMIYALLFYKINFFFSISILGQSPLLLFVSLFYKFYWFWPRLNCTTHYSKWAWAARSFGYLENLFTSIRDVFHFPSSHRRCGSLCETFGGVYTSYKRKKTPLIRVNNFSECFTGQLKIKPRINLQSFFIENKNDSRF